MEIFLLIILAVVVLAYFMLKQSFKNTDFVEPNEVPYKVEPPVQPLITPVVENTPAVEPVKKARKPRTTKTAATKTKKTASAKTKKSAA